MQRGGGQRHARHVPGSLGGRAQRRAGSSAEREHPTILHAATDLATDTTAQRFDGRRHGVNVSFFLNHTEPGRTISLHQHEYPEVFVVQDGEATITVGDQEVRATGGMVIVVPPRTLHGFTNTGDRPLQMISIHPVATMVTIGRDDPQADPPDPLGHPWV